MKYLHNKEHDEISKVINLLYRSFKDGVDNTVWASEEIHKIVDNARIDELMHIQVDYTIKSSKNFYADDSDYYLGDRVRYLQTYKKQDNNSKEQS